MIYNGQQPCEKMLNIIHHQGHKNENHNEVPIHIHQDGCNKEIQKILSVGNSEKELDPLYIDCGNIKMVKLTEFKTSRKIKEEYRSNKTGHNLITVKARFQGILSSFIFT